MSVLANKRKESQFEVFNHFYKVRRSITDLLLRDFGYNPEKAEKHFQKMFDGKNYDDLSEDDKTKYINKKNKNESFENWFILEQRKTILDCLRSVQEYIFLANSIYPQYMEELIERRIYQDKAMRRKLKKLAGKISLKEFEDLYNSWFNNHYKIMSKQQRFNINQLFLKLRKEHYENNIK